MGAFLDRIHATKRAFTFIGFLLLVLALPSVPASAAPPDPQDFVAAFDNDVFVIVGSTLRNPDADTSPTAPLFNNAGVSLGLTWGDWQAATATTSAKKTGHSTDIRIDMAGLIPGGIYSVFYGTLNPDSENPLCPGVERTLALTAKKAKPSGPDASSFTAGADGTASYRASVAGDLLGIPNQQVFYFIIYHFDGGTYHPLPNRGEFLTQGDNCRSSFGEEAMRQLLIIQK